MKVEITPTQDIELLKQNLEKRIHEIRRQEDKLVAIVGENAEKTLERTPGIEKFETEKGVREGIKGRPVQDDAYARLDSRRDLARAVVATIDGYDLRILDAEDDWSLKILRTFNPDVKELKMDEPSEALGIDYTLEKSDEERKEVEIDLSEEEVEMVLRFASLDSSED